MERQDATDATFPLLAAAGNAVLKMGGADVGRNREEMRRKRLWRLAVFVGLPAMLLWWRIAAGHPVNFFQIPHIDGG